MSPASSSLRFVLLLLLVGMSAPLRAATDTWTGGGTTDVWRDGGNWTNDTPYDGYELVFDTLQPHHFATSEVNYPLIQPASITFTAHAPAYTLRVLTATPGGSPDTLVLTGKGFVNNSGKQQKLTNLGSSTALGGVTNFTGSASAGNLLITNQGGYLYNSGYGRLIFDGTSTAGTATIVNQGGVNDNDFGGMTLFEENSTAGAATITVAGGTITGGNGGEVEFKDGAHAGTARITVNGGAGDGTTGSIDGGDLLFLKANADHAYVVLNGATGNGAMGGQAQLDGDGTTPADGGNATFIVNGAAAGTQPGNFYTGGELTVSDATLSNAHVTLNGPGSPGGDGGKVRFLGASTADHATIRVNAGATFDISGQNGGGLIVGSLSGAGTVALGSSNLQVGKLNTDMVLSGTITDLSVMNESQHGSLTKIGSGILTLSAANRYGSGTTVAGGTLLVNNAGLTSGTGTGRVMVKAGTTLGGSGRITGNVINAGTVAPGNNAVGALTCANAYTQQASGKLLVQLGGKATGDFDRLNVGGAATLGGTLRAVLAKDYKPKVGDTFQIINAKSVTGSFATVVSPSGSTVKAVKNAAGIQLAVTAVTGGDLPDGGDGDAGER